MSQTETDLDQLSPEQRQLLELLLADGAGGEPRSSTRADWNETEQELARIWAELLGAPVATPEQDFIELGGDSLKAIRLLTLVQDRFGVKLRFVELYDASDRITLGQLARTIEQRRGQGPARDVEPELAASREPGARFEPFPLRDVQEAYLIGRTGSFELGGVSTHVYEELDCALLDVPRLAAAVQQLMSRHGMLRAVITPDGQQRVLSEAPPFTIPVLDLRGKAAAEVEQALLEVRQQMAAELLPTDAPPLLAFRASLLPDQRTRLHVSIDALFSDAWSLNVLFGELELLYRDPSTELPPLEFEFRDYVLAERALRQGEAYRSAWAYWRQRLESLPPGPELPLVRAPAGLEKPVFRRRSAVLDASAWQALKSRASGLGLTSSVVLLAAFGEVLARFSKQPRFCINLTLFNRQPLHPQVDRVIGDFTSLTLLEVDAGSRVSFEARARAVQKQLWADLDHRLVSGVEVLRQLLQRETATGASLRPVVFTSTLNPGGTGSDGTSWSAAMSWLGTSVYGITQTPQVWLDHQVAERGSELVFNWDVVEELFPDGLLDSMWETYGRLLRRLAAEPAAWTSEQGLELPAAEARLEQTVEPPEQGLSNALLHTLAEHAAARFGERPAVISPARTLTHAELGVLSGALAARLAPRVRPNALVAIVMHKGWEQVVAALAVLKSGAAYLPLDPDLPARRLHEICAQAEPIAALTQGAVDARLDWPRGLPRIVVDSSLGARSSTASAALPETEGGAGRLAYVIFTSGSSGKPKGVMIDHRGALNTILDINARTRIGPEDRVLAVSSLGFDLSVYDIFGVLGVGGAVVVPDAERQGDPDHLIELGKRHGVTVWNSVPALMQLVAARCEERAERLPLRQVLLSGDWIPVSLPERVRGVADPGVEITSLGGATEASIWSVAFPIADVDPAWRSIPYGKALANQRILVLNSRLESCPIWVPGRLYIAGVGLALGYLNDPERTRERFIRHPVTGERLYWTGDLGRWLPDGNVELLGREDLQVKVQGYRIEVEEVETALRELPAIADAVVVAVDAVTGGKRLVAFFQPGPAASPGPAELGAELARKLPHYMIPTQYRRLDRFPQNSNGKLDRKALVALALEPAGPEPAGGGSRSVVTAAAAETPHHDPLAKLAFRLERRGLRPAAGVPTVSLPRPELEPALLEAFCDRRSYRSFEPEPLQLGALGAALHALAQLELPDVPLPKAGYGSAGGLYPVQLYVYVKPARVADLVPGTYYYDPARHAFHALDPNARLTSDRHAAVNRALFEDCACALFLVANRAAIEPEYGAAWRDFALLEAGAMVQLLETRGPSLGLGFCQTGALDFAPLAPLFRLGPEHAYLHSLVCGAVARERRGLAGLVRETASLAPLVAQARLGPKTGSDTAPRRPGSPPEPVQAAEATVDALLSELWRELLGRQPASRDENFFDAGGNSLGLIRLVAALRERLELELPVAALFEHPTLAAQVEYVRGLLRAPGAARASTEGEPERVYGRSGERASERRERVRRGREGLD